jgi:DNA-binding NarL/FixJ family response regulator
VAEPELVRIVISDEQPIFRDGLRRLLETASNLKIVGEGSGDEQTAAVVREIQPDILLLGLPYAGPFQLDALEHTLPTTPVRAILLAGPRLVDTFEVMTAALQVGAHGIVPKDSPPEALFESIRSVMAGRRWVGRESVADVAASFKKLETMRRRAWAFGLTRRELEIVRAVVGGENNKSIASRLSISENTVKRHLTQIFNKVGVSNRIELVTFAAHHRLVERW